MNMKILISFCAFFICVFSFGQSPKGSKKSLKNIDLTIEKGTYDTKESFTADKLILNNATNEGEKSPQIVFNENEWRQIKAKIVANRQRVVNSKEIHSSQVIDTIYVEVPSLNAQTQLSGW